MLIHIQYMLTSLICILCFLLIDVGSPDSDRTVSHNRRQSTEVSSCTHEGQSSYSVNNKKTSDNHICDSFFLLSRDLHTACGGIGR